MLLQGQAGGAESLESPKARTGAAVQGRGVAGHSKRGSICFFDADKLIAYRLAGLTAYNRPRVLSTVLPWHGGWWCSFFLGFCFARLHSDSDLPHFATSNHI